MPTIQEVMTANPTVCQEQDTVFDAVQVMKNMDTGVVPVVDQSNKPCGIVTDRDICLDVVLQQLDPASATVSDIMTTDLLTCSPQDELDQVVQQMGNRQVKRILVTDNDELVGIVSEADIARFGGQRQAGELASGVYQ